MATANELAHVVQLAGLIGVLLAALFSVVAGDRPVALAAIFYVVAAIGSVIAQAIPGLALRGVMAIDVVYLVVLLLIAGRWRRQWSLWAVAFQLLGVLTHFAYLVRPVGSVQYLTLLALWTYLVMAAVSVGAGMAWQRRRVAREQDMVRATQARQFQQGERAVDGSAASGPANAVGERKRRGTRAIARGGEERM